MALNCGFAKRTGGCEAVEEEQSSVAETAERDAVGGNRRMRVREREKNGTLPRCEKQVPIARLPQVVIKLDLSRAADFLTRHEQFSGNFPLTVPVRSTK